jgi:hypothetical protein
VKAPDEFRVVLEIPCDGNDLGAIYQFATTLQKSHLGSSVKVVDQDNVLYYQFPEKGKP